jgi:ABC-type transport system involved in multi-copper enzyme maturation permease subunit
MLRALVWKEWREQRPLLLSGLVLAAIWPLFIIAMNLSTSRPLGLVSVAESLPVAYALVLWPLFTVAAGASTIANEIGDRTLEYLLSRPVSRARVWSVKLAVGAGSTLAIVAGSLCVVALLRGFTSAYDQSIAPVGDLMQEIRLGAIAGITLAAGLLLLFSFGVFFSSFLPRAMTAAAAGIGASIAVLATVAAVWSRLDLVPRVEPQWMAIEIAVIGAIVLMASLFVFSRGEMLRGRGVARVAAIAGLSMTGVAGTAIVPVLYAQLRLTPAEAVLSGESLSATGDAVVFTASSRRLAAPETWLVHTDAPGLTRLAGRLTFGAAISPDGRWVAYLSNRTPLGLRSDSVDLRAARADGSEDRLLAADLAANANTLYNASTQVIFSPDGRKVALSAWWGLIVASMDGAPAIRLDRGGAFPNRILGWTRDGGELLAPGKMDRSGRMTIRAYDVASGRSREIYGDLVSADMFYFWRPSAKGVTLLPVMLKRELPSSDGRPLLLVDVGEGTARTLTESSCFAWPVLTDDERHVAYASCVGPRGAGRRSEIHLLDLMSGEDLRVTSIEGEALELQISPAADRLVIKLRGAPKNSLVDLIVDARGGRREVDTGWDSIGWAGRDRLLLMRRQEEGDAPGPARLSVLNVDTGARLDVYP